MRRNRGSTEPHKFLFSSVPIGSNDDDKHHVKKRRATRHFKPFLLIQQARMTINGLGLMNDKLRPAICVCLLIVSSLCLSSHHLRLWRSNRFGPIHTTGRRRLENLRSSLPLRVPATFGETRIVLPKPLSQFALERWIGRHYGGLIINNFEPSGCPREGCRRQIYHDPKVDETKKDRRDPDEGKQMGSHV
jgi:hypothetical protein